MSGGDGLSTGSGEASVWWLFLWRRWHLYFVFSVALFAMAFRNGSLAFFAMAFCDGFSDGSLAFRDGFLRWLFSFRDGSFRDGFSIAFFAVAFWWLCSFPKLS